MTTRRIALITGASRGIGAAVARRFATEGAHVILAARDGKGLEAVDDAIHAAGGTATLVQLDLTDTSKIQNLAEQIGARFGKLDILVGNAGLLGELSPLQDQSPEEWDKVLAVNVTANFHLIRCFDALLKQAAQPRAVFVTSGITAQPSSYWGAYATSKAALEAMVKIYAAENTHAALRVNLIDPGVVRTRMRARAFPGEDPLRLPEPEAITDIFIELCSPGLTQTGQVFYAQ